MERVATAADDVVEAPVHQRQQRPLLDAVEAHGGARRQAVTHDRKQIGAVGEAFGGCQQAGHVGCAGRVHRPGEADAAAAGRGVELIGADRPTAPGQHGGAAVDRLVAPTQGCPGCRDEAAAAVDPIAQLVHQQVVGCRVDLLGGADVANRRQGHRPARADGGGGAELAAGTQADVSAEAAAAQGCRLDQIGVGAYGFVGLAAQQAGEASPGRQIQRPRRRSHGRGDGGAGAEGAGDVDAGARDADPTAACSRGGELGARADADGPRRRQLQGGHLQHQPAAASADRQVRRRLQGQVCRGAVGGIAAGVLTAGEREAASGRAVDQVPQVRGRRHIRERGQHEIAALGDLQGLGAAHQVEVGGQGADGPASRVRRQPHHRSIDRCVELLRGLGRGRPQGPGHAGVCVRGAAAHAAIPLQGAEPLVRRANGEAGGAGTALHRRRRDRRQGIALHERAQLLQPGGAARVERQRQGRIQSLSGRGGSQGQAHRGSAQIQHRHLAVGGQQTRCGGCAADGPVDGVQQGGQGGDLLGRHRGAERPGFALAAHRQLEHQGFAELAVEELLWCGGQRLDRQPGGVTGQAEAGTLQGQAAAGAGSIGIAEDQLGHGRQAQGRLACGGAGGGDRQAVPGNQVMQDPWGLGGVDADGRRCHPGARDHGVDLAGTGIAGAAAEHERIDAIAQHLQTQHSLGAGIELQVAGLKGRPLHAGGGRAGPGRAAGRCQVVGIAAHHRSTGQQQARREQTLAGLAAAGADAQVAAADHPAGRRDCDRGGVDAGAATDTVGASQRQRAVAVQAQPAAVTGPAGSGGRGGGTGLDRTLQHRRGGAAEVDPTPLRRR